MPFVAATPTVGATRRAIRARKKMRVRSILFQSLLPREYGAGEQVTPDIRVARYASAGKEYAARAGKRERDDKQSPPAAQKMRDEEFAHHAVVTVLRSSRQTQCAMQTRR